MRHSAACIVFIGERYPAILVHVHHALGVEVAGACFKVASTTHTCDATRERKMVRVHGPGGSRRCANCWRSTCLGWPAHTSCRSASNRSGQDPLNMKPSSTVRTHRPADDGVVVGHGGRQRTARALGCKSTPSALFGENPRSSWMRIAGQSRRACHRLHVIHGGWE